MSTTLSHKAKREYTSTRHSDLYVLAWTNYKGRLLSVYSRAFDRQCDLEDVEGRPIKKLRSADFASHRTATIIERWHAALLLWRYGRATTVRMPTHHGWMFDAQP